jgi:hypothetical protein
MVFVLTVLAIVGAVLLVVFTDENHGDAHDLIGVLSHAFTLGLGGLIGLLGGKAAP